MNFGTCVSTGNPFDAAAGAPRRRLLRFALAITAVLVAPTSLANNGDLDKSFGAFHIKGSCCQTYNVSMVLQSDGRAVVGGTFYDGNGNNYWAVFRRNPNGTPDTSFGGGTGQVIFGIGETSNGKYSSQLFGLTVQPNGKIIAVGNALETGIGQAFHLVRLLPDGSFDPSFGNGGDVIVAQNGGFELLALQEDGKIVLAGASNNGGSTYVPAALRYTTTGLLDTSFGTGGVSWMPGNRPAGASNEAWGLAIRPDGSIVVAVMQEAVYLTDQAEVIQLTKDGLLDTSFGTGGVSVFGVGSTSLSSYPGFTIRPDGEIAGIARTRVSGGGFTSEGFVYRLFRDGTVAGWSTLSIPNVANLGATPVGQLLFTQGTDQQHLLTGRLNANGGDDTTFTNSDGDQGVVVTAFPKRSLPGMTSVAIQDNGRFVVAGSDGEVLMARYYGDPLVLKPAAFAFTNATGVPTSTVEVSNIITISGLTASALVPIQVVGGSYSINGDPFTKLLGYVKNGDRVMVKHTSAATSGTSVTTKLKVGGVSDPTSLWAIRGTQKVGTFTSTTQ